MLQTTDLLLYLGALIAVYLLPGPDMAMLLATALNGGSRPGLLAALGLAMSRAIHVLLSGLGLATLLMAHPPLFNGVRILGALYLLWLAGQIMMARGLFTLAPDIRPHPTGHAWRQGLLTNLMNPKALIFCALLLPQFMPANPASHALHYLVLGSILVLVGGLFDVVYVLAANRLRQWLSSRAKSQSCPMKGLFLRGGFAGVFVLAALRLLWH